MGEEKLRAEWFWCDRWAGSSAFLLPIAARGLYREMLTAAWARGARLPNNHEAVQRAVGATTKEWRALWPIVEPYWRVDGDSLVNDTQLAVYVEAQTRNERASSRGKKGAQAAAQARAQASSQAKHETQPKVEPPSPSPSPSLISPSKNDGDARPAHVVGAPPIAMSPAQYAKLRDSCRHVGQRLRVPKGLHVEFMNKLGGDNPDGILVRWYLVLDDELVASQESVSDFPEWLRPKFKAWVGEKAAADDMARWAPGGEFDRQIARKA